MTDEEFAAIKARWRWNLVDALPTGSQAKADVRALCDHVERLREIVLAVAEAGVGDDVTGTWLMFAGYDAETVRAKARRLLGE